MGQRALLCAFVVLVACGDNIEPPQDEDAVVTVALETHAPAQVAAGDQITVSCTLKENELETMVTGDVTAKDEASVIRMDSATIIARTVGTVEVACALPDRGIVDPTPAIVEIVPGPPANLVTEIVPDPVVAGNSITATCAVYDAHGNLIDDAPTPELQLSPADSANTITGLTAEMIRAGHYTSRCYLPGTTSNLVGFDVVPNLPATISIAKFPDLPVYALGTVVQVNHVVTDRYGNEILDAAVSKSSTPITGSGPIDFSAPDQFSYRGEGRYRITATVDPPTDMDAVVSASTELVVNSRGPAITCANDGRMINMNPGASLTVTGNANDINGVSSITVNGTSVQVGANGSFSASVPTRWGMNFVDITARDTFDEPTTRVCTFLVSNRYFNPADTIPDEIALKLTQPAIDDGDRSGALGSLGDVLHTVLNSDGLKSTVDQALSNGNPIKPYECHEKWLGACVLSSEITYLGSRFSGPNTTSLTLVDGGVRAIARMNSVGVNLRVTGRALGIPYNTSGWVNITHLEVQLTLDLALSAGKPAITVRNNSVSSSVGTISTQFGGLDGWILNNIVVPLARNQLQNTLSNLVTTFVRNNFNSALDGIVSSLDISSLGTTFNVPRLDGSGSIAMAFGLAFSSLSTTSSRVLFGIGTRFTAPPPVHAIQNLGVPLPPGSNLLDPSIGNDNNAGLAAHVGIFNHALHALWRAYFLDVTLTGAQVSGLPANASIDLEARLPPIATILSNGTVQLQLGAIDLVIQHPDLPANLAVRFGADAHATVTLNTTTNDLTFGAIVVDQVYVSTDAVNLDPQDQQDLEAALLVLAQDLVNKSLNNALPAIPIPTFTLPDSLADFDLPAGARLGIKNPALSIAPQHFTLRGNFGLQ